MRAPKLDISNKKKLITFHTLSHPKGFKDLGKQFLELNKQVDEYMNKYVSKYHAGINVKDIALTSNEDEPEGKGKKSKTMWDER